MTDFYSQNRCVCSTRSHGPLLYAFCLCFHFKLLIVFTMVVFTMVTGKLKVYNAIYMGIEAALGKRQVSNYSDFCKILKFITQFSCF